MCHSAATEQTMSHGPRQAISEPIDDNPPIKILLEPPSLTARYTCSSFLIVVLSAWWKFAFIDETKVPDEKNVPIHNNRWDIPIGMTIFYLCSLPLLKLFTDHFLSKKVDVKRLLWESMIIYNAAQVVLNGWMVYRIVDSLLFRGHAFISGPIYVVNTGAPYAVYVHYCNKYLEYLDTYFMILRGKMDQVRLLGMFRLLDTRIPFANYPTRFHFFTYIIILR
jgi:elongation of very long chain fatty acids protein 4